MHPDHGVESPVGASAPPLEGPRRRRVLVIDDDAGVRALICEFLQLLRCSVRDAATGAEGLALFEEGDYDVVVTDLMMPDLTGWDVVGAVRRRAPEIGIIMVTGSVGNVDPARARALGVTVVTKPLRLEDLKTALGQVLGAPASATAQPVQDPDALGVAASAGSGSHESREALRMLRSVLDGIHRAAADLEAALVTMTAFVRAHEALLQEHGATLRAFADARAQHEIAIQERRRAIEDLEVILRQLRP
jgi:CheY-like chemotaxis protein